LRRGKTAAAVPLLLSAERRAPDAFLKAEIAWKRAEALRALGRFREALAAYWTSHRFYRLAKVPSERLRTLLGASACLRILGRYGQARRMWAGFSKQSFVRQTNPSPEEVSLEIALVERGAGRLRECRRRLLFCVRGFGRKKDAEGLRHAWWALGGAERFLGNYPGALRAFVKAEQLARRQKDPAGAAYALCGQAGALRILGDGPASLRKYKEAHKIFKRAGDPFGEAYGLCGMGNALRVWGDARLSLPLYRASRDLYRRVGDEGSRAFALWGLGGSSRRLGKFPEAAALYREALRDFKKVDDIRGVVMARLGLSRTAKESGRAAEARAQARAALKAARGLPYETALSRFVLGAPGALAALSRLGLRRANVLKWRDIP